MTTAISIIQTGVNPNDGTGDDLRTAFQKINSNFQNVKSAVDTATGGAAANIPITIGSGYGIYYSKGVLTNRLGQVVQNDANTLNLRSLIAGTGISLTTDDDNNIVVTNNIIAAPGFVTFTGNSGTYTATSAASTFKIEGDKSVSFTPLVNNPTPYTVTTVVGNKIIVSHDSRLVLDTAPTLGANLTLNSYNISGSGNINYTGNFNNNSGTLTAGASTVNSLTTASGNITTLTAGTLQVNNSINVTNSVTAANFLGPLTGDTSGAHTGDIKNSTGTVIFTASSNTFSGTTPNPLTFSGLHTGGHQGYLSGDLSLTDTGSVNRSITGTGFITLTSTAGNLSITSSSNYNVSTFATTGTTTIRESIALKLVQKKNNLLNDGPGLAFSSVDLTNTLGTVDHGVISMMMDQTGNNGSAFYVRLRSNVGPYTGALSAGTGLTAGYKNTLRTDALNNTHFSGVKFSVNTSAPYYSKLEVDQTTYLGADQLGSRDLLLDNQTAGFINFYNAYKFPKNLGTAGQTLTVPFSGNTLTWTTGGGGGGGGGVSYMSALLDGPGPYLSSDANKIVAVNASYDGFVYSNTLTGLTLDSSTLNGNASTATALQNARTISGVSFDGTANITLTTDNIQEGGTPTNVWYTDTRARNAVSVTASKPLTYSSTTGIFDINASTASQANYLVQRDASGIASAATIKTDALAVNTVNNIGGISASTTFTSLTGTSISAAATYTAVSPSATSGSGIGATFTIVKTGAGTSYSGVTTITRVATGTGYAVGNTVTIPGASLGGATPANNLTFTLSTAVLAASTIVVSNDLTGAFNINTTGNITANNLVYGGAGPFVLTSPGVIQLNPTTYVDLNSKAIQNLALTPTNNGDATSKKYVDDSISTVSTASMTQLPITANQGGSFNLAKGSTLSILGGANITTTTGTNSVTVALNGTISNINFSSGFNVTSGSVQINSGSVKAGNVQVGGVDGNTITQTSSGLDLKLVPGSGATPGAVVVNGYLSVDTSLNLTSNEQITIPPSSTALVANVDVNVSFVTTQDWLNDNQANLAFITLPASNRNGQIKTFKMKSRGTYGANSLNLNPRYAIINGNIDGTQRSINLSATSPNGAITLISLNGYWWIIGNIV